MEAGRFDGLVYGLDGKLDEELVGGFIYRQFL
jgi:hypothetical protein